MKAGGTISVGELIEELKKFPDDLEVLMAVNHSAGFSDDCIDTYPIEDVYGDNVTEEHSTPYHWFYKDETNDDKVILYAFP